MAQQIRLASVANILSELRRLYRLGLRGERDTEDCARLTSILRELRAALESSQLEARMSEIERQLAARDNHHANGAGRFAVMDRRPDA